jgi:hypothetical protein
LGWTEVGGLGIVLVVAAIAVLPSLTPVVWGPIVVVLVPLLLYLAHRTREVRYRNAKRSETENLRLCADDGRFASVADGR